MTMFGLLKRTIRSILPGSVLEPLLSLYHLAWAYGSALWYGFPARKLVVLGVTGTKGKSSVTEMVNAILEESGYRTALANTIRFKIDTDSRPNRFKMSMPGRGYLQKFLADARGRDVTHVVLEITSEGARQFRNRGIPLNALIFTNIAPEHIEAHGSYEAYKDAKRGIARLLASSPKRPRIIVANPEDELGAELLRLPVDRALPISLKDAAPYELRPNEVSMTVSGITFSVPLPGTFTVLNALSAAMLARELGVPPKTIAHSLSHLRLIPGRLERIDAGQPFSVIVDYAHTPDSLKALFDAFPERKICVFGATGGGRDHWKRPAMGKIADDACAEVILTNDDPYEEDPRAITEAIARGMKRKPRIIIDRREAIREAFQLARAGDAVLIAGKGTDPYLMESGGRKTPWSDAAVAREELERLLAGRVVS